MSIDVGEGAFLQGLWLEWKSIVLIMKAHEDFKSYSLSQETGILNSDEDEVIEGVKLITNVTPLVLLVRSKVIKSGNKI